MPDSSDLGWFLGGVVTGVVIGKMLAFHAADEDRPVIVVSDGSMRIRHGKKWKRFSSDNRRWHPDHPSGRPVDFFAVQVNSPSGHPPRIAQSVTFIFSPSVGIETTVNLRRELVGPKMVPFIESSSDLEHPSMNPRLLLLDVEGRISRMEVDGEGVQFSPGAQVEIEIFSC